MLIYPQFLHFSAQKFRLCHFNHCFRISFIVVPLMLIEVGSAGWLLWEGLRGTAFLLSAALIPVVWLSTAVWQAPMHTRLSLGFDEAVVTRLVMTNWVRTLAWTARGVLVSLVVL